MSKHYPYDPGLIPGSLAVGLILVFWGYSYYQENRAEAGLAAATSDEAGVRAEEGETTELPPVVLYPPESAPLPAWEEDERWQQAVPQGEAALEKMKEERLRHEREGDPFRYRHEMGKVAESLQASIAVLEGMREDFAGNRAATTAIDREIERFRAPLAGLRKES